MMQLKIIYMKSIINRVCLIVGLAFVSIGNISAQEIIQDQESVSEVKAAVKNNPKIKIDGVVAVVGEYIILDSDIDKSYLELSSQGGDTENITRCEMIGTLLESRLYAHQAIQDSIIVKDAEVNSMLDQRLEYIMDQIGSADKVLKFYKKNSMEDLRSEFFDIIKMNKLTDEMQRKIVNVVEITPEEVRSFYKKIPQDELPVFGAEMEVAQIVVNPEISDAEKQKAIDKLKKIKKEVQEGASFFSKAVLYSDDPGSRSSGGYYKITRKTQFLKEFKDVAFSLAEGEISEPFETDYGYHIIYLEKIRGQELDIRHILIMPKITDEALKEAKEKAELIRKRIVAGEISFADAARSFSEEKETKNNGGILLNPKTMETHFELTKMDPSLYNQVSDLKDGAISFPILDEDQNGKKRYKLVTVTNRFEEHKADYAKDYIKIKQLALREKQIKVIGKWSSEKIKETYIKINGKYRVCSFANNWLKK